MEPVTGGHLTSGRESDAGATTQRPRAFPDLVTGGGRVTGSYRDNGRTREPPENWHACDDAAVVAGMRQGWEAAYGEFFDRFTAMLTTLARRRDIPPGERMALVLEFLDDIALRLGRGTLPVPRAVAGYLAASFRHRMALHWRREEHRHLQEDAYLMETGAGRQRAVTESLSEYAVRSTEGADQEEADSHDEAEAPRRRDTEVRRALADTLLGEASDDERRMLGYLAEHMPQREIARLFGITPGAARVRILRLRERLRKTAVAYANERPVAEGLMLARLLRRSHRASASTAPMHAPAARCARTEDWDDE